MLACNELGLCGLKRVDHTVAPGIEFGIGHLQFGMRQDVRYRLAYALVEADRSTEVRYGTLQFAVVEKDGTGLVANQATPEIVGSYGVQEAT